MCTLREAKLFQSVGNNSVNWCNTDWFNSSIQSVVLFPSYLKMLKGEVNFIYKIPDFELSRLRIVRDLE